MLETLGKGSQPLDGVGGFDQAVEGEVELVAIRHRDQRQTNGRSFVTLEQQVAQCEEIAFALRHFAAIDQQKADVHPMAGKGLMGY